MSEEEGVEYMDSQVESSEDEGEDENEEENDVSSKNDKMEVE